MRIDGILLENFRNYRREEIRFHPQCNVICGENAQGKTNLLEAMVYLACGKSPRTRSDRELIRLEQDGFLLEGTIFSRDRSFISRIEAGGGRRKRITINKVPAKTASELSGVLNTIFFSPEDLQLIREGPIQRRRFLDASLCQLRPRYAAALAEYGRTYDHKTRILRDAEERPDLLSALPEFNQRLVRFGAVLIHYRQQFTARLREYAALHHRECSGGRETLEIQYKTVSSVEDPAAEISVLTEQLWRHMEEHQAAERASRLCLSGPHKDDLLVSIDGRDAKRYASQGQTRTAALAMKLAEREIYKNAAGEYPVLLLDDVLSELDPRRQEFVLNRIAGGQVFITCCEEDRLPSLLGGKVFHVEQGRIL